MSVRYVCQEIRDIMLAILPCMGHYNNNSHVKASTKNSILSVCPGNFALCQTKLGYANKIPPKSKEKQNKKKPLRVCCFRFPFIAP